MYYLGVCENSKTASLADTEQQEFPTRTPAFLSGCGERTLSDKPSTVRGFGSDLIPLVLIGLKICFAIPRGQI